LLLWVVHQKPSPRKVVQTGAQGGVRGSSGGRKKTTPKTKHRINCCRCCFVLHTWWLLLRQRVLQGPKTLGEDPQGVHSTLYSEHESSTLPTMPARANCSVQSNRAIDR
jgi:hypothetical protein